VKEDRTEERKDAAVKRRPGDGAEIRYEPDGNHPEPQQEFAQAASEEQFDDEDEEAADEQNRRHQRKLRGERNPGMARHAQVLGAVPGWRKKTDPHASAGPPVDRPLAVTRLRPEAPPPGVGRKGVCVPSPPPGTGYGGFRLFLDRKPPDLSGRKGFTCAVPRPGL